jgi:hypothetical protein
MAEEQIIFAGKLKHSGLFDFKELYKFAFNFLKENKEYLMMEKTYSEKVTGETKEIEIKWEGFRKISDYFKLIIKPEWRIVAFTTVEVEKDGKKVKMNKGDLEIAVKGILVRDWDNKWETGAFVKFLRSIYDKYIIKNRINELEDKIFGDSDEFLAQVKAFLVVESKR